ncbi:MAG: class I SAM-dependent methyltransferase [Oscillospiraceae bacterium]|nr:class I SAM-dependent methyltransferase [Oscillospiraceae bacterium]
MVESKGWDWESIKDNPEYAAHLRPTEFGYYYSNIWKDAGRETVLDLGTGLGRHAICFAKAGLKVSAIDMSEYGIKHLQSWAENEKLEIDAKVGDMMSLPYADKSFDCLFACHVISHSDSTGIKKIIKEIERVLKPNGEVFLSFSSKETTDFIEAVRPKVDDNTMFWEDSDGPDIDGSPLFYADLSDIIELMSNFDNLFVRHTEYCSLDVNNKRKTKYYYVSATLK